MPLDMRTLWFVQNVIYLTQAAVLLLLWRTHRHYRPTRDWALGMVAIPIGILLNELLGSVPELLSIMGANALVLGGVLQICKGLFSACERRPPLTAGWVVFGAAGCGYVWFTYVEPSYPARVLIYNMTFACFQVATLVALLTENRGPTRATRRMIAAGTTVTLVAIVLRTISYVTKLPDQAWANSVLAILSMIYSLILTSGCTILTGQWYQAKLEDIARRDPLTGLFNRRAFKEICDHLWAGSVRQNQPLTALMLDIDHFKQINDRLGHAAGDTVLRRVADVLISKLRPDDLVCRYGGEEFAVLLPNTSETQALAVAERLRFDVATLNLSDEDDKPVTISIGVAQRTSGTERWEDVLACADQALYLAKQAGRNLSVSFMSGTSSHCP
jgi:diguanylate cyclase (GGDEF)-like protein